MVGAPEPSEGSVGSQQQTTFSQGLGTILPKRGICKNL